MRRAALNQFFSKRRIALLEELIQEDIGKFLAQMEEYADTGRPPNLEEIGYSARTIDLIGAYALGVSYNILDQENFN